jgi:hypothetical protein
MGGSARTTRIRRWHRSLPSGWWSTWSGQDTGSRTGRRWVSMGRRWVSMGRRRTRQVGLTRPRRSTATSRAAPGGRRYRFRDARRRSPNNPRAVPRRATLAGSGTGSAAAPDGMLVATVATLQGVGDALSTDLKKRDGIGLTRKGRRKSDQQRGCLAGVRCLDERRCRGGNGDCVRARGPRAIARECEIDRQKGRAREGEHAGQCLGRASRECKDRGRDRIVVSVRGCLRREDPIIRPAMAPGNADLK